MIHLHHLENSRSFRILWLLEELAVDYRVTCYERNKSYLAPDRLQKIHPLRVKQMSLSYLLRSSLAWGLTLIY